MSLWWSPTVALLSLREAFAPHAATRNAGLAPEVLRAVEAEVAPGIAELESLRRSTVGEIDLRGLIMVPIGILLGAAWGQLRHGDLWAVLVFGAAGAAIAAGIAYRGPEKAYRAAYKARILPHLVKRFGDLIYRAAQPPDMQRLVKLGLVPGFARSTIEDEIVGTYRDTRISMIEANLETGGKNSKTIFNGLIVVMDFPGRFAGTTIVTRDPGSWIALFADFTWPSHLERVRLEDPDFEARYQVYGSDQIAARALLTPAIMERIMELETHSSGDPPRLLAEPGRLWVTIPKRHKENLFEPPPLSQPLTSASRHLEELSADIASVLRFVDTVLELDPLQAPALAAAR